MKCFTVGISRMVQNNKNAFIDVNKATGYKAKAQKS